MSEVESSKSHAARWLIGCVLALVLYLMSADPVLGLLMKYELSLPATQEAPRWLGFAHRGRKIFYTPAEWMWNQPFMHDLQYKWTDYLSDIGWYYKDAEA